MFDFLFKKQKQEYEARIKELEEQVNGKYTNSPYCGKCENSFYISCTKGYGCLLEIGCKNFKRYRNTDDKE